MPYYPVHMRKGQSNHFCCPSSVVVMKIARSQVLGICACCNYHELVDIGEKLVSVRIEWQHNGTTNRAFSIQHACGLSTAPTPRADLTHLPMLTSM